MITLGQNEWTVRRRSINIHEEYLFLNSYKIKQKKWRREFYSWKSIHFLCVDGIVDVIRISASSCELGNIGDHTDKG